jgi:hypothetical protein
MVVSREAYSVKRKERDDETGSRRKGKWSTADLEH